MMIIHQALSGKPGESEAHEGRGAACKFKPYTTTADQDTGER